MSKRVVLIITISILLLSFCGCQTVETDTQSESHTAVEEAHKYFDNDCNEYSDIILKTEFYFSKTISDEYNYYNYTIFVDDNSANEFKIFYDMLMGIHSGVSIDDEYFLIKRRSVKCNDVAYSLEEDGVYYLSRSDDASWKWMPEYKLTDSEKRAICRFIEQRYEHYDENNGNYSGDKYSDIIMQEAADKYGITAEEAYTIWTKYYSN